MITRTSLADEVDELDKSIKALNDSKGEAFTNYREQMLKAGVAKENIKKEIDAVKAAIKRRRAASKDENGLLENEALADEIFNEITRKVRAPRAHVEIIEKFSTDGTKYDATSGEILDDINPRLAKQVIDGMQTEAGRAALMTAVDIMIEREEAEEDRNDDMPVVAKGDVHRDTGSAMARTEASAVTAGETATNSQSDDDAIAEVKGIARLANAAGVESSSSGQIDPNEDRKEGQSRDVESAAANTGGNDVDSSAVRAGQSDHTSNSGEEPRQSSLPVKHRFRPNCQNRDHCRSGTADHCHSCKVAMREREDA
jgi:hypothetical protein